MFIRKFFAKKIILIMISGLFVAGLFTACSKSDPGAGDQDVIKLRFSSPYFEKTDPSLFAAHMCDLIEQKTNGKVKFDRYYGGSLGSDKEHMQMIGSGSIDMGIVPISINSQQYPLNDGQPSVVPLNIKDTVKLVNKFRDLPEVKVIMEEEQAKKNIKIFNYNAAGVNGVITREPVKSMSDLKGKKVNTLGPTARICWQNLGWLPVNLATGDIYESLSRGVIDGGYGALSATYNMKWYEEGKTYFCLDVWSAEIPVTMNLKKYNSLPQDIQKAFVEAANETAEWTTGIAEEGMTRAFKDFEAAGCKVVIANKDEKKLFYEITNKYKREFWMNTCEKAGLKDKAEILVKAWDKLYQEFAN